MIKKVDILSELVIVLAVIILIISIFRKIKIPPLAGFLLSGLLIGPYGFGLIKNIDAINVLAEVGVILLLFTIGLEFSLTRLKKIKRIVLLGGGLQVGITIIVVAVLTFFIGLNIREAVFLGFLISLSSTAIVMKLLSDSDETNSQHGKISLGILLFQDLCIIPMMLLLPVLSPIGGADFFEIILRLLLGFGGILVLILISIYLMPKIIDYIVFLKSREIFVIGIVFISLGTAVLTSYVGLSLALGAFIAGLVLSESEYSHEIVATSLPFRDALSSLFFISIGMLVNTNFIFQNAILLILSASMVILVKYIITSIVVLLLQFPVRTSIIVGLSLSQIGEFSFILAISGIELGVIEHNIYQLFLAVAILSMMLTPIFFNFSKPLVYFFQKLNPFRNLINVRSESVEEESFKSENLKNHVIIVGYGLNGKNVATVLKETGINYIIVDSDGNLVKEAKRLGEKIVFGDATTGEVLLSLNVDKAKVMVVAISDNDAMRRILKYAKKLNPDLYIIARTRSVSEIEDLFKLGASEVIPEEFETSIEIFTRVLRQYHIPRNIILTQVDLIRRSGYGMLRGIKLPDATTEQLEMILSAGTTDTYLVLKDSPASGKTLSELNIRFLSGASVIAIVRDDKPITNPPSNFKVEAGDILVLIGTHAQIDKAFELLNPPSLNDLLSD